MFSSFSRLRVNIEGTYVPSLRTFPTSCPTPIRAVRLAKPSRTNDSSMSISDAWSTTTEAVASRAFGSDPMRVAALGRATLEGLAEGGVVGIVKHMPGHGRAKVDTHHHLPTVTASDAELEVDLEPFRTLNQAPMGMTSHIVFDAWDADRPATLSPIVIDRIIRERIGFDGLLMTDDIDMKALSGTAGVVASAKAWSMGCGWEPDYPGPW